MTPKNKLACSVLMLFMVICSFSYVEALDNGSAKTPPMGWNSWNCFGENINEKQIKEIADVMASSGLKDAGYIYLNIDDNWMATSRDADGNLRSDPTRFPKGMKDLGDYIHSKGLKFGIYGDRGTVTCVHRDKNRFPMETQSGSIGREERDAKTFASWGVDYLKYDNCEVGYAAPSETMQKDYEKMRDALANSGRDIVFSICAWEFRDWMPKAGNLWRTTTDILNIWKKGPNNWSWGILDIIDLNEPRAPYAKPGAWNDPDMLQVGNNRNGGPTNEEYRSHFSLWCIMAAPLILGNDIRNMTQETKDIILNREVIAVDQDSAGIQGTKVKSSNGLDVWCKPLGSRNGNIKAVALFNRNSSASDITVNFSDIGLNGEVYVRDLWAKSDKGKFTSSYTANVPSHGTVMLKISGEPPKPVSAFDTIQAESYSIHSGIQDETCNTSDRCIGYIENDDYVVYDNLIFDSEPTGFEVAASSNGTNGGSIEIRLDSLNGKLAGTCEIPSTGDWSAYVVKSCKIAGINGNHKIFLKFTGGDGYLLNINWFRFLTSTATISFKTTKTENNSFTMGHLSSELIITPVNKNSRYNISIFSPRGQLITNMKNITNSVSVPVRYSGVCIVDITCNGKRELQKVTLHR